MGLEAPRLDDRSFQDIVNEARARIALYAPEWTDHNLSDPGITLIELFAWMTDIILYRLNRVPDKHFVKFMELVGMKLMEATPARADVSFWLTAPQTTTFVIPNGTEVATTRTESEPAIVFSTDGRMDIKVPKLDYVLTALEENNERIFRRHNAKAVTQGIDKFRLFASNPIKTGDALYLGFEEDMSHHLMGIDFAVDTAEGAGINPLADPPYIWEVLSADADNEWRAVAVDIDNTKALNINGIIRLHLPEMRRSNRADLNAYWIRCRYDNSHTQNQYEVSPEINQITVASWGGTVGVTNVSKINREVLGRSDGTPGQRFHLEHFPLLARTASEFVIIRLEDGREQRWEEVSDFSTSTGVDRHYTIDSESGEIRFGPAIPQPDGQVKRYGALPPKGAMVVMSQYRFGGGQAGNVAARTVNVLKEALPYIAKIENRFPAIGGQDAEALENAKLRVPGYLRSLQRAVTAADYEYLAREAAPERVGRVNCLQPPLTQRGENIVLIIPHIPVLKGAISPESLELPEDVRQRIRSYLDERRLLSTRLEVTTPQYQWVETQVQIRVSQHADVAQVTVAVEQRLFEFINPLTGGVEGQGWPIGRDLLTSDVIAILLSVPGVEFVRSVKLYPVTYEDRNFERGEETNEISVASHAVVVSYQHTVLTST
jgi:predicted phage baseplate assembly protein